MVRKKKKRLTIKKIVSYCPSCCEKGHIPVPKKTTDLIVVVRECPRHKPKFKRAENGVMVLEGFLEKFEEMMQPVSLSSQKI